MKYQRRYHCAAQCVVGTYHMQVNNVCNADQQDNQNLLEDFLESDSAGQLFVDDGAHDSGDVVDRHKDDQRSQQAVHAAKEVAEPAANGGNCHLKLGPNDVNGRIPHTVFFPCLI